MFRILTAVLRALCFICLSAADSHASILAYTRHLSRPLYNFSSLHRCDANSSSLPYSNFSALHTWRNVLDNLQLLYNVSSSTCPDLTVVRIFATSLLQFCKSPQGLNFLSPEEEIELARFTVSLSAISLLSGVDFSGCRHVSNSFCLPVNEQDPCDPSFWWQNESIPLPLIVAHVTAVSELSTYVFPGLHFPTRRYIHNLLVSGLNAESSKWHVTGLPAPNVDSVIPASSINPQYAFYFSVSYRDLLFERSFKQLLHTRTTFLFSRAPIVVSNAEMITADNLKNPEKLILPNFSPPRGPCLNKTNILVIDSFWLKGFASHRVTRPLVNAMLSIHCVSLLYGVQGSFANFADVAKATADDNIDSSEEKFVETFGVAVWDEKLTGRDWRLALANAIQMRKFDAVWFTSVGMTSFDTVLASLPLSRVQSFGVGHPSTSGSALMTHFLSGVIPEVIGPLSSSILEPYFNCHDRLLELEEELHGLCIDDNDAFSKTSVERVPLIAYCSSNKNSSVKLCKRYTNKGHLKDLSSFSQSCRGINSDNLFQRLIDAQKRYTEQLVLAPGIGMGLTSLATNVGGRVRREIPSYSPLELERLKKAAIAVDNIGDDKTTDSLCLSGISSEWSTAPLQIGITWSNPKWNQEHLQRLFSSLRFAQQRYSQMRMRCLNLRHHQRRSVKLTPCSLCERLLAQGGDVLQFKLLLFVPMDGLRAAAMQALLTRQVEASVPFTTISHVFNAGHMGEYLSALGESDLGFDSQPFSGGNTLHDFLSLSVPVVSLSHDGQLDNGTITPLRWRSALGASILTISRLTGLVAIDDHEQMMKFAKLATNPFLRDLWRIRIAEVVPHDAIQSSWDAKCYAKMISLL